MAGPIAVLGARDRAMAVPAEVPFAVKWSPRLRDLKVLLLIVVLVHVFFKLAWAFRHHDYSLVLMGCVPAPGQLALIKRGPVNAGLARHFASSGSSLSAPAELARVEVTMGRSVALVLILGFAVLHPIQAPAAADPELADTDQAAIRTTIERQLAAFQRDDGTAAFEYAAPSIKEKFGTPEDFMTMVRTGYEPVYRPREVEFQEIMALDGGPAQQVLVVDQNGLAYLAYYLMQQQRDGRWLIKGCILRQIADRAL